MKIKFIGPRVGGLILLVESGDYESRTGIKPPAIVEVVKMVVSVSIGHFKSTRATSQNKVDPASQSWAIATRIAKDLRSSPSMWTNVHEQKIMAPIGVWTDGLFFPQL